MTWEIVAGIIALIGVFGTVAGWSGKLSRTIATLEATINVLNKTLEKLQNSSEEVHEKLQDKIDDHEKRIIKLENK